MTSDDSRHRRRRLWLLLGVGIVVPAIVVIAWTVKPFRRPAEPLAKNVSPPTPVATSRFLNTKPDVKYVGSEACRSCHVSQHESFRHTGMGRSMAEVDLSREPPDAEFDHPPSKRRYQVRRQDGQMWHRELLLTGGKDEVVLSEYPVKYVTGSGRHSLTYVAEAEGFLVESPVTWYTSRQAWGMSPGYDQPNHNGFERAVGEGCLVCHAGQAQAIDGSLHRMRVTELAIGCERCHGPGALHVQHQSRQTPSVKVTSESIDVTIVNPAHLSRGLAEAICQQCHLRTSATVVSRGRTLSDFRPGLPLQAFRQDYALEIPDKPMTVVGHVEQMHLSRCYQATNTFTCSTCHSPHGEPPAEERVAYYKSICLNCHQPEQCHVDEARRAKDSPQNDCVHCHMPSSATDIPHLAFTHHRVGVHEQRSTKKIAEASSGRDDRPGVLTPFLDISHLSGIDQTRSLGLGYLDVAIHEENPARRKQYQRQALALLSEVHAAGVRDGVTDASLASLCFDLDLPDALPFAQRALTHRDLGGMEKSNALFLMADAHFRKGRYAEAKDSLLIASQMRRHSIQWLLKAECEKALGNQPGVEEALLTAVRINPRLVSIHQHLAEHFERKGDAEKAAWHRRRAVP